MRRNSILMTAALAALVSWYLPSYAEQKNPEDGAADKKNSGISLVIGREGAEIRENGKVVERVEFDPQKEGAGPAVEEAAPDSTTIESLVTVEPDQSAIGALESKTAEPVIPEGAEKIDISSITLGTNDWEKGRANVEGTPLLSTEYLLNLNEKIKERLYFQFSAMKDGKTSYKVYSGVKGGKAPSGPSGGYKEIGTLALPIGTKEEKFINGVDFFYHILKMCEEKKLKGHIVCVYGGDRETSYAYLSLEAASSISSPK